jgi:hypothetical protein
MQAISREFLAHDRKEHASCLDTNVLNKYPSTFFSRRTGRLCNES